MRWSDAADAAAAAVAAAQAPAAAVFCVVVEARAAREAAAKIARQAVIVNLDQRAGSRKIGFFFPYFGKTILFSARSRLLFFFHRLILP